MAVGGWARILSKPGPAAGCPSSKTPNAGNEYKVWLIPTGSATISSTNAKVLLFANSNAKTDNFKAQPSSVVQGSCQPSSSLSVLVSGTNVTSYVPKGSKRVVDLVAIDSGVKPVAAGGLKALFFERRYVSVLTQQRNGTYRYESQRRDVRLSEAPLKLAARSLSVSKIPSYLPQPPWAVYAKESTSSPFPLILKNACTPAERSPVPSSDEKGAPPQIPF